MMKLWHSILLSVAILASLSLYFDNAFLLARQEKLQWDVGNPDLNSLLHSYLNTTRSFCILTDYGLIQFLPGLENHYELFDISNANDFAKQVNMPYITELLVPESGLPDALQGFLRNKLSAGEYQVIGRAGGHLFIKVK